MNILGFSYWEGCHDTSAAIVCDGELVAAAEEERFSRRKHDGSFPIQAIAFCLDQAGLRMAEVDAIAFPDRPFRSGRDSRIAEMDFECLRQLYADGVVRYRSLIHKIILDAYLRMRLPAFNWAIDPVVAAGFATLCAHYEKIPQVHYVGHHLAHAAATYCSSGHEEAAIATIDYQGDWDSTVTWRGEKNRIRRLRAAPFTNSLGHFYSDCTEYLGLGEFGEGKTMGLASYGNVGRYSECLSNMLERSNSWYTYRHRPEEEIVGFRPRTEASVLEDPYPDFAAAAQRALEEAVGRVVQSAMDGAKTRTLCLGGGVMLNCSSNGSLLTSGAAASIWIFPAAGDAGLSVGAAFMVAAGAGEVPAKKLDHAYWGPDFSPSEYETALRCESRISFKRASNVAEEVSRRLEAGEIVGWFQGRMEFGPRALGNRSILADPRKLEIRDRVNTLKGRELWRPLAPVVLAEHASEFFSLDVPSPFMLFATQVRLEKRSLIPAVVHADGSARPQTITRAQNPLLHDLILAFYQRTQVPVLLNTSFNADGEPIVCTPQDAITTFLETNLDLLVLGDWLVRRRTHEG